MDADVVFEAFQDYWGGAPDIEFLKVVRYEDSNAVKAALNDGTLDIVWGSGVLTPDHIIDIASSSSNDLSVFHSDDIQNVIILLNSGKAPLDNIQLRKTIIHAIDKKKIIQDNLGGLFKPVDNVFPRDAPFSDVDLFPRWDYDMEKAVLLNCPSTDGADLVTDLESKIEEIRTEKETLTSDFQAQVDEASKEKENLEAKVEEVAKEKSELEAKVSKSDQQVLDLTDELNGLLAANVAGAMSLNGIIAAGLCVLMFVGPSLV